jgi:general secretion pathway protein C
MAFVRLVGSLVWLLVGFSLAWWGWRIWGHVAPQALPLLPAELAQPDPLTVARALGAGTEVAITSTPVDATKPEVELALTGWVRDAQGMGVALLKVAGQPPAPFRVGAMVTDHWRLEALSTEDAVLRDIRIQDRQWRLTLQASN